jgi:chorismate mutase
VDDELMQLLAQRMNIAEKIGEYKKNNNVTILQAGRWNELRDKAIGKAVRLNLSEDFIEKYMDAVHMESINRQNKIMNA